MKANLKFRKQGVKGQDISTIKEVGFMQIFIDNLHQYISLDSFEGSGETYQQSLETTIKISNGNGKVWSGSYATLVNVLFNINKPIKH